MFEIPGTNTRIPAFIIPQREASEEDAWLNAFNTVKLYDQLVALRVHVGGGVGAVTEANQHLAAGSGLIGRWYAIGDFIKSYDDYISSSALPMTQYSDGRRSSFTKIAIATFGIGAVLNVGRAGPLFGHAGKGEQAEHVDGPFPFLRELDSTWVNRYGNA